MPAAKSAKRRRLRDLFAVYPQLLRLVLQKMDLSQIGLGVVLLAGTGDAHAPSPDVAG